MSASSQHLALVFLPDALCVALWQSLDGRMTVLSQSSFAPLESTTLPAISAALDSILDQLGEAGLGVKDCLFCVPNSWTDGDGLRGEKKTILKHVSDDLVLKPLGFVVNSDALAASDKIRTGRPFDGLIVFSSDLSLTADLYHHGVLGQSEEIGRSRAEQDVHELLARFAAKPARILLVEGANPEDTSQLDTLLQTAAGVAVEVLPRAEMAKTVITTGGAETLADQPAPVESKPELVAPDDDNGFQPPSFLVNRAMEEPEAEPEVVTEPVTAEPEPEPKKKRSFPKFQLPALSLTKLRALSRGRRGMLVAAGVGLVVILGIVWLGLSRSYRAVITVAVSGQPFEIEETFLLTADEADVAGATRSALRAESVTESVTVDKEVPTTGSKIIGDQAKGKVTLFNRTSQSKTFPAGTKLATNKLIFTLDGEVTVASSSSQSDYSIVPGTADVNVTAAAIGPESNLGKDTEFTVANFDVSSYVAKNKEPLAGGTSREIQAVSAKDIDQAKKDLLQAAETQLRERFDGLGTDEEPVLFTGVTTLTEEKATAKIGDEQKFVGVTLTVEGTGARLRQEDAVLAAQRLFTLPEGFTLQEETIELEPKELSEEKGVPVVRAVLRARGVPAVSASQIVETVAGQYAPRAQTLLQENQTLSEATVSIQPSWAGVLFNRVPADTNRISVSIRLKESP